MKPGDMLKRRKPIVAVKPDGTVAERYASAYECQQAGLWRTKLLRCCNGAREAMDTGGGWRQVPTYRGRLWMWQEDYDRMAAEGRVGELRYDCRREWRRRVAFTFDWRGLMDDQLVVLFKGATVEILEGVFGFLCAGGGVAKGYEIREGHDVVRLWRHQYERLEVWIEGYNQQMLSLKELMVLVEARLRAAVKGDVDFYLIDDWLNLTDRREDQIRTAWAVMDGRRRKEAELAPTQKRRGRRKKSETEQQQTVNNINNKESGKMPMMYVRVPWYLAGFYRGRNDDRQLTEFEPYEFPDHDDLMLFMEHHLRFLPEQNQSVFCLSERAFANILHGKPPGGGKQIMTRNPEDWPTVKELCALTGKFVTDKQESSDYLCIAIPKEILDGGRLHRTNGSYALPKKEAERFISYLRQEFKREFEAFCEVDEMNCLENKINRSDVDRMERFLANYNMPISVDPKDRESLRKLMFRMRKRKNIQPYLRRKLDQFVNHISEEDRVKAERWEMKKSLLKRKQENEG